MTCNGCRGHVEEILSGITGVEKVVVTLEEGEAIIEMKSHLHRQ